jgi:RNA polymerase sigma-70 factor (ECF subfamily)
MPEADGYFVRRCLDGHPDDYRYLVRRYQGVLTAHLVGQLGSRDLAEEVAQEVLVRCYFGLDKLRNEDSFFSWMLGTANHTAKEHLRKLQRDRKLAQHLSELPPRDEQSDESDYALARSIAGLSEQHRQMILLRYYGGCSCKEVADILGLPLGTVTKTLSRAYAQLREKLAVERERQVQA